MSSDNRQITELAKQGLSAHEIAMSLGYEVEAVEFVLAHDKEVSRELEKAKRPVEKVDAKMETLLPKALEVIQDLLESENESIRGQMGLFVAKHAMGLMKPKTNVVVVNVRDINEQLRLAREKRLALDVVSEVVPAQVAA